jgi:hypothetical protein
MGGGAKRYAYLIDVAIPNSPSLHSTTTEELQKYTDLKEELIRMLPLVLSTTGIIPNKLHESLKLPNLMQKAVTGPA